MWLAPIRMVHLGTDLPSGVALQEVQFQDVIIEHKEYYDKSVWVIVDTIIIVGTAPTAATKLYAMASSAQRA